MSHQSSSQQRGIERSARDPHAHVQRAGAARREYTLAHAGRQVRFGPVALWVTVSVLTIMALWSGATATYFAFRDDLLTRLIARQADMQYAYEDRITELRAQVDRLTSRQLLDQEQVENRIEQLARRQSTLESRTTALSGVPDLAPTGSTRPGVRPPARNETAPGLAKPSPINDSLIAAPVPERQSSLESRPFAPRARVSTSKAKGLESTLASLEHSLDRVEARQAATLSAMQESYEGKARRVRGVLAEVGLNPSKLPAGEAASGIGGPFVPVIVRPDANAFEHQLQRVQLARANMERLNRTLTAVPLRKPLDGEIDTSSGFGVRMDPFFRAPAMHSGLDFRGTYGDPVRATAAGTVVSVGWNGGYGRMVEIDHGNGFSTRYGHLSETLVSEDQTIKPGQIVGRLGSTGRSTGPHLHYETRVDGDAVDPQRFLRAGLRLGERP